MERELGVPVVAYDDNSKPRMVDFHINYQDGRRGALEVTSANDPDAMALWKEIGEWIDPTLAGGWLCELEASRARVKTLKSELPVILRILESMGVRESNECGYYGALLSALGVVRVNQLPTSKPGSIYLNQHIPTYATFISSAHLSLNEWIESWVLDNRRSDNLRKLSEAGCDENHLFVFLVGLGYLPNGIAAILFHYEEPPLPKDGPKLPPEIDHFWIANNFNSPFGLKFSRLGGWSTFRKF